MRICIVTINDFTNYGNRLQNYALTKILESYGHTVYNGLTYYSKEEWERSSKGLLKKLVKKIIPYSVYRKRMQQSIESGYADELKTKRSKKFIDYTNCYTNIIEPIIVRNNIELQSVLDKYSFDYYMVGSDQVWNPEYAGNPLFFLRFAEKNKRLSFSASIGTSYIPTDKIEYYTESINGMKNISVREKSAAKIAKSLTGRDAIVTLDPTLLLNKENWEASMIPVFNTNRKYIFAYFLGEIPEELEKYSEEHNLEIKYMNSKEYPEMYCYSPGEFLYLLNNAELVFTDSFHAIAFSIVLHKDFYVFRRKQKGVGDMFSRLENVLSLVNLERRIQEREVFREKTPITHEEWSYVDSVLKRERIAAEKMLNEIIE